MTAAVDLEVFKLRNEPAEQVACRFARVRVNRTVNHQHPRRYCPESLGLDTLALKTQRVLPGFTMPGFIGRKTICGLAGSIEKLVRLRSHVHRPKLAQKRVALGSIRLDREPTLESGDAAASRLAKELVERSPIE